jgi:hypothetical protein
MKKRHARKPIIQVIGAQAQQEIISAFRVSIHRKIRACREQEISTCHASEAEGGRGTLALTVRASRVLVPCSSGGVRAPTVSS